METIKIDDKQLNALLTNAEVMVAGVYPTGMLFLLEQDNNTIVSCDVMEF